MSSLEIGQEILKLADKKTKQEQLVTISSHTACMIKATLQDLKDKGEMTPTEANVIEQKMLWALENGIKEAKDKVKEE